MKIEETKTRSDDPRMLDYYIVQLKENSTIHAKGFFNVDRYELFKDFFLKAQQYFFQISDNQHHSHNFDLFLHPYAVQNCRMINEHFISIFLKVLNVILFSFFSFLFWWFLKMLIKLNFSCVIDILSNKCYNL